MSGNEAAEPQRAERPLAPTIWAARREWRMALELVDSALRTRDVHDWPTGDGHPVLVLRAPGPVPTERAPGVDVRLANGDLVSFESYLPFSFDKQPVDLGRIAAFKPPELLGQHGVEGISDHGHDDVEVHLDQDGEERALRLKNFTASEMTFSTRHLRA